MKKIILEAVVLGIVASLMAATNPSKENYIEHTAWSLQETACKQEKLPLSAKAACAILSPLPPDMVGSIVDSYTRRQNFVFFSLYTTKFMGMETRSIGAGGHFFKR